MDFIPAFRPPADGPQSALWFIFEKSKLLVSRDNGTCGIPEARRLAADGIVPARQIFLGYLGDSACYAAELEPDTTPPAPYAWMDLRALMNTIGDELFWIAGRANHLMDWDRSHRFCGRCGQPTVDKPDERAKHCPACGLINYPRLSPAVIVAVLKGDRLLLARNKRFRGAFYSVLAGFVEPGETLEQCVMREIREEVGIAVKNIRYFGSQPWPFPNSLMVGFVADYAGGEITVDNVELMEAAWFTATDLPQVPPRISIARQLIDWFVDRQA
ncbi:NADH pyrophosphatase [Desulfosarcina cetonica]|uniref:NAD(+) diphosphatase n=1 Tax=Desulfosarcina cetonica TaxID=90730 RepID=UPI0006D0F87C|nr:NAD(+) diphosphatase [Desulfosarcina cetonica]VTR67409.1 NADH pyrophosphatase [Desulfosarcina cetonica]